MLKNKIFHITPHLGGGVGRVLLNYLSKVKKNLSFTHSVACLDYANKKAIKAADKIGFSLIDNMSKKKPDLLKAISASDVVLIHWWNHPLLYDLLVREQLPASRVIIWSHTSGVFPPGVYTSNVLKYPDIFVFTTPISLKTKEVENLPKKERNMLRVVWSTGGVKHVKSIKQKKHSGFNIGYIGTVDYAKLHPNFLSLCRRVNIPKVKFIVCGGNNEKKVEKEAKKLGLANKLHFTGPITNIADYLSIFDVFGYPLAPYHYGTCDQVLAESMGAGIVPVVLANQMEKHMVKDGITGIVAKNEFDYVLALEKLYNNQVLRKSLSQKAKKYALKNFALDKLAKNWDKIFKQILTIPKTRKTWKMKKKKDEIKAVDIFLEALGNHRKVFDNYLKAKSENEKTKATEKIIKLKKLANWQAKTKGTVHHYSSFFPKDRCLSTWSQLMRKNE